MRGSDQAVTGRDRSEPPTLGRRSVTGVALAASLTGLSVLSGCSSSARGTAGTGANARDASRSGADPDLDLVTAALAAESGQLALLQAHATAHPRLDLASATAAHTAHVELLRRASDGAGAPATTPVTVAGDADRALAALARAEGRLVRLQAEYAAAAASGSFARVLASMAASAAQQQQLLSAARAEGPR